jgi:nucleoside triphosphate diphosphatase
LLQSFNVGHGGTRVSGSRAGEEFEQLLAIMARLRSADGCPWDREQTLDSLRPFILEEAYELAEAIHRDETSSIREELGDLLLEIVFVNQIAEEQGRFGMAEVVRAIHDKLVRRHPHVFRDSRSAASAGEALERWEEIKDREKPERRSLLDGVARALPALARAQKISTRAARGGFDWKSPQEVLVKVAEEMGELEEAMTSTSPSAHAAVAEELGDLLFVIVNLARHVDVDAEVALADATEKFSERFRWLESRLAARGCKVSDATMEELDGLWKEAKASLGDESPA